MNTTQYITQFTQDTIFEYIAHTPYEFDFTINNELILTITYKDTIYVKEVSEYTDVLMCKQYDLYDYFFIKQEGQLANDITDDIEHAIYKEYEFELDNYHSPHEY